MRECVQQYFTIDGQVRECGSFNISLINEGRTIYEVARLAGTRLLFMEDHIDRLFTSLALEGYSSWLSREEIQKQLEELILKNSAREGNVKFVMNFSSSDTHHFLAYFTAHRYPAQADYLNGVKVLSYPYERIEPNKKIWRPEFRAKVASAIRQNNVWEALLLDSNRCIPEASRSNIFGISKGRVITPPDEFILTGITRKYVLKACMDLEIPVELRMIYLDEIKELDALFITSTSLQVLPVRQVDEIILPHRNAITEKIIQQFDIIIQSYLR